MTLNLSLKLVVAILVVALWEDLCLGQRQDALTPILLDSSEEAATRAFLVHGKVEKLHAADGARRKPAQIRIMHVYWLSEKAPPATVTDYHVEGEGPRTFEARIPFEIGEEGIWLVLQGRDGSLFIRTRIRKSHDARYAQFVEQAKFLEAIQLQSGEKRIELALRNLSHATPEVAMAAAHIAVDTHAARARTEVLKLAESPLGLHVGVQIAFDQAYVKRFRKEWWDSSQRSKFIAAWPREAHDEETLKLVVGDLANRCQHVDPLRQEVPASIASAAVAAVARNEKNPKEARKLAIRLLASMPARVPPVDHMFECLAVILRDSKDLDLRRYGTAWLPGLIQLNVREDQKPTYLSRAQINTLVALERTETDAKVKQLLVETIKKANDALQKLRIDDPHVGPGKP